ncbi:MAG: HD domain-containing protein [Xanthomonadaceae bacterium]|nr:HD domain-containing protein [Xanthomonadaceae bacterium]MDE2248203.1 HD domain-containing protein [Xanthomonadaceae bacterium]
MILPARGPAGGGPSPPTSEPFLAALAIASESLTVRALDDIFDAAGVLLVSREHELPVAVQQRLARRHLARPMEACIGIDGGVTALDIEAAAVAMCQGSAFLALLVGADLARLQALLRSMWLSPFASLVLSVQRAVKAETFEHAVLCAMLAGTLALRDKRSAVSPESAVHAGLLHDVGEMYLNPDKPGHGSGMDTDRWVEMAQHPEVGARLIEQFTEGPSEVWRAVHEHHERLDGSGYPRGLGGDAMSPLGRLLSLVEAVCGILRAPDNQGRRVKLAVSFVAGEFDPHLVSIMLAPIGASLAAKVALPASFDEAAALERARSIRQCLDVASHHLDHVTPASLTVDKMDGVVAFARRHVARLALSWAATGIDTYFAFNRCLSSSPGEDEASYLDLEVASRELKWRMRSLARHVGLMLRNLPPPIPDTLMAAMAALDRDSSPPVQ